MAAGYKNNGPGCCDCSDVPCVAAQACISFNAICAEVVTSPTVTLAFTPDDVGGTPVSASGSTLRLCLTHVGSGTIAWTFAADTYLAASGSFAVPECGDYATTIDIYPSTYQVCLFGCNIVTDGTDVTVTASGSFSASCTPTATTIPAGHQFAGTAALCCTFALSAPVLAPPTITVSADRYAIRTAYVNQCSALITMHEDPDHFCCDPTNTGTCKPVQCTLILSTPVGDFHIDQCSIGHAPFVTAIVPGRPVSGSGYFIVCGCDTPGGLVDVPVTFFLTEFACRPTGWIAVIGYTACPHHPSSIDCTHTSANDWVAVEDGSNVCFNSGPGVSLFALSGECPPGEVGTFHLEVCHNRYLSGAYTLTEA